MTKLKPSARKPRTFTRANKVYGPLTVARVIPNWPSGLEVQVLGHVASAARARRLAAWLTQAADWLDAQSAKPERTRKGKRRG